VAILMVMDVPGGTAEQYDRVNEILGIRGDENAPPGLVHHVCAVTDRGLLIIDLWESHEALDAFFVTGGLSAALKEAGVLEVQPRVYAVLGSISGLTGAGV
jgi:hypothetical protein